MFSDAPHPPATPGLLPADCAALLAAGDPGFAAAPPLRLLWSDWLPLAVAVTERAALGWVQTAVEDVPVEHRGPPGTAYIVFAREFYDPECGQSAPNPCARPDMCETFLHEYIHCIDPALTTAPIHRPAFGTALVLLTARLIAGGRLPTNHCDEAAHAQSATVRAVDARWPGFRVPGTQKPAELPPLRFGQELAIWFAGVPLAVVIAATDRAATAPPLPADRPRIVWHPQTGEPWQLLDRSATWAQVAPLADAKSPCFIPPGYLSAPASAAAPAPPSPGDAHADHL